MPTESGFYDLFVGMFSISQSVFNDIYVFLNNKTHAHNISIYYIEMSDSLNIF